MGEIKALVARASTRDDAAHVKTSMPAAGAGLCIGISRYSDSRLAACPSAARTARAIAEALAPSLTNGVATAIDPKASYELFLAIQGAIQKARGGLFVLYFAGITIRRDNELLFTTVTSSLDAKGQCVPWSDIEAMLQQENVPRAVVVLNAEGFAGIGWRGAAEPNVHAMGSIRVHDPLTAERRIAEYGDAVVEALRKPAHELRAHLDDGQLDVASLGRYLAARFPRPARDDEGRPRRGAAPWHETFGSAAAPNDVVLRDLREELIRSPSATSAAVASSAPSGLRVGLALLVVGLVAVGAVLFFLLRG